jgi:hypothetical protein
VILADQGCICNPSKPGDTVVGEHGNACVDQAV